jgi:hypothetical protein
MSIVTKKLLKMFTLGEVSYAAMIWYGDSGIDGSVEEV